MSESPVPLKPSEPVAPSDDYAQDGFAAWLLERTDFDKNFAPDAMLTDDEKVTKLANAVSGCIADECLPARSTSWEIAAHVAAHAGQLPQWVVRALEVAQVHRDLRLIPASRLEDFTAAQGPNWGPWRLCTDPTLAPWLEHVGYPFELTLGECREPYEVLQWITWLLEREWVTDADLAGMVRAMFDLLDPVNEMFDKDHTRPMTLAELRERVSIWSELQAGDER